MIRRIYIDSVQGVSHVIKVKQGETVHIFDRETHELLHTIRYEDIKSDVEYIKVGG